MAPVVCVGVEVGGGVMVISEGVALYEGENSRSWKHSVDGIYTFQSTYIVHVGPTFWSNTDLEVVTKALQVVWKSWGPSQVQVFSSKFLLDRMQTRQNLFKHRATADPASIVCCIFGGVLDSADHLFVLSCVVASRIWYKLCKWLAKEWVYTRNVIGLVSGVCGS